MKNCILTVLLAVTLTIINALFSGSAVAKDALLIDEQKLVDVCEAIQLNDVSLLKRKIESAQIRTKSVADKLMCNQMDAVTFAESVGATQSLAYLAKNASKTTIEGTMLSQVSEK